MEDKKVTYTVIYFTDTDRETTKANVQAVCPDAQLLTCRIVDPIERNRHLKELLDQATGSYITVVDEGDLIPDGFFSILLKTKIKKNILVSCSKEIQESVLNNDGRCCENSEITTDGMVKLKENMLSFPVTLNGTLIPNTPEIMALWEEKGIESEKNFLLNILLQTNSYYCAGSLLYRYIHPRDGHYAIYSGEIQREWYFDANTEFMIPLLQKAKEKYGEVPVFLQYFALYFITCRLEANLNNRNKHVVMNEELSEYIEEIAQILAFVDDEYIVRDRADVHFYWRDLMRVRMLLQIKYRDFSLDFNYYAHHGSLVLGFSDYLLQGTGALNVNVMFIEYSHGKWEMDLSVPSMFSQERVEYMVALDGKRYPVIYNEQYSLTKYFGKSAYKRITFHASVPIRDVHSQQELRFLLVYKGREYLLGSEFKSHFSRLSNAYRYAFWRFGKFLAFQRKKSIVIRPAKKWYMAYREFRSILEMLTSKDQAVRKIGRLRILYHLAAPKYARRPIWLFYDKIYKGGDSSEYLYKYTKAQDDGIDKYYLIDKDATDYERLKSEGYKPLVRGSLKHRLVFLYADMMIISNSTVFAFNDYTMDLSAYIRDLAKFHVCCVQHGMSVQTIAVAQRRLRDNTRLYFLASKYEEENLLRPVYDYAGYNALRMTGVPRYDGLVNRAKKQILISPTWRMQAAMLVSKNEGVERDYNPLFKETSYYKVYNSLVNNPRLLKAAREYGYRIHYVLHPIVSPQIDDFDKNDVVDIIPAVGDMSYEKEFCESALMVTDFSGIQFDFAYMRKPVVYLHHDAIPQHYGEGTFFYDTMGFGEIVHNNDDLIDLLVEYMKNDCKMKDEYRARADDFFTFDDHNNCARIYKEMIEHQHDVIDRVNRLE